MKINGINLNYCTCCEKETAFSLSMKTLEKEIRNKTYKFKLTCAICNVCREEVSFPGLLDLNVKEIDDQYRQIESIVSVEDIEKVMDIYNIGKTPLSIVLGFGEITITRYLLGQVPSKEYSDKIKHVLENPKYMLKILNENKEKIGDAAYKKAITPTLKLAQLFCLSKEMLRVISYIFEKTYEVTPLALQKLLYFAQGLYLAKFDKPLFNEDCEAWVHGPVYETVYNLFSDFKYNPIDDNRFAIIKDRFDELNGEEKEIVDLVINTFGKYSGRVLENITHNEQPWINARNNSQPFIPSKEIISKDAIKAFYQNLSKNEDLYTSSGLNKYISQFL